MSPFQSHMQAALEEARAAAARGEVPVGAVLVDPRGRVVARDGNRTLDHAAPNISAGRGERHLQLRRAESREVRRA